MNKNTGVDYQPVSLDTENPSKQGMNDGEEESLNSGEIPKSGYPSK
jgi:hypothetical protein